MPAKMHEKRCTIVQCWNFRALGIKSSKYYRQNPDYLQKNVILEVGRKWSTSDSEGK